MVETRSSKKRPNASTEVRDEETINTLTKDDDSCSAPPEKLQRHEPAAIQNLKLKIDTTSKSKEIPSSKTKKASTTPKIVQEKPKRKRATRKDCFSDLPVELHFEIASNLTIKDLLWLSRVSHRLRSILLSRSSRHVWTECIKASDIPSCPIDLSEPKYASMLFENCCDVCATADKSVCAHYELRIRLCPDCLEKTVKTGRSIVRSFDTDLLKIADVYTLIPHLHDNGKDIPIKPISNLQEKRFVRADFIKALEGYKAAQLVNSDTLVGYVAERQQRRVDFVKQCITVREWASLRAREQEIKKNMLREQRWYMITEAAKDKGYSDREMEHGRDELRWNTTGALEKQRFTNRDYTRLLTQLIAKIEKDRAKRIKRELESRTGRRESEFESAYKRYLRHLRMVQGEQEIVTFPTGEVVLDLPPVKEMLQYDDYSRPITYELFLEYLPSFEQALYELRVLLLDKHVSALSKWHSGSAYATLKEDIPDQTQNQLHLATSFFSAYEYKNPYYISSTSPPAVTGERKISPWFAPEAAPMQTQWFNFREFRFKERAPAPELPDQAFRHVKAHDAAVDVACALLEDLGMSQQTRMVEVLDVGRRFVCLRCEEEERCGMGWVEMIQHYLQGSAWFKEAKAASWRNLGIKVIDEHARNGNAAAGPLVKILTDDELERLYSNIASLRATPDTEERNLKCRLCETLGLKSSAMTRREIEKHVLKRHGRSTAGRQEIREPTAAELKFGGFRG